MEKVVERYALERINNIIDKHLVIHTNLFEEGDDDDEAHAGAIACLIMLKKEINGEVEY